MIEIKLTLDVPPHVLDVLVHLSQNLQGVGAAGVVALAKENAIVEPPKFADHANRSMPTGDVAPKSPRGRRKDEVGLLKGPREDLQTTVIYSTADWDRIATKTLCEWVMFCNSVEMAKELLDDPSNRSVIARLNDTQRLAINAQIANLEATLKTPAATPVKTTAAVVEDISVPEKLRPDDVYAAAREMLDKLTVDGDDAPGRKLFSVFMAHALGDGKEARKLNTLQDEQEWKIAYVGAKTLAKSQPGDRCRTDTVAWAKSVADAHRSKAIADAAEKQTDPFGL